MRLLRRRTVWLIAALLLLAVVSGWFFAPRSRITQENYDRIHEGMLERDVDEILGEPNWRELAGGLRSIYWRASVWIDGPNYVTVFFDRGKPYVTGKQGRFATAWETVVWHVKKGAAKIGVK